MGKTTALEATEHEQKAIRAVAALLFATVVVLAGCGSAGTDPAFSGAYPCGTPCASDEFCFLDTPGVDTGVPVVATCVPFGSCSSTPRCDCLYAGHCGTSARECGVAANGYVLVCHEA